MCVSRTLPDHHMKQDRTNLGVVSMQPSPEVGGICHTDVCETAQARQATSKHTCMHEQANPTECGRSVERALRE